MKQRFTIILAALLMAATGASAQHIKHYVLNVGDFTQLQLVDKLEVDYASRADSAGYVTFDCDSRVSDNVLLKNNQKGKLTIALIVDAAEQGIALPRLHVYSNVLREVVNDGNGTITVTHLAATPVFKAKVTNNGSITVPGLNTATLELTLDTGKGRITATGQTAKLQVKCVGTGCINALGVEARDIFARILGTGHIYCTSTGGELNLKGTGSGRLFYQGTPSKIKVHKLGSIKALPYDGKPLP